MGAFDIDVLFPSGLTLGNALEMLGPVMVVLLGMTVYAVFVFKFYRFVAARDMFGLDLSKNDEMRDAAVWDLIFLVWYAVRYIVLFPAFAFFWFAVLTLILVFLSEDRDLSTILMIAMATVSAIRVSAYYNEELSRDLAKILPFAVLGVFIIDTSFFNIQSSLVTLQEISEHREIIVYYLMFLVVLEFALRFVFVLLKLLFPGRREPEAGQRPVPPQTEPSEQQNGRTVAPRPVEADGRPEGPRGADLPDAGVGARGDPP